MMSSRLPGNEWLDHAACRDHPTSLFYPERGAPITEARRICRGCEVRRECLDDAMNSPAGAGGDQGVRAGLSAKQRRQLRRRLGQAVTVAECGTPAGYMQHIKLGDSPCQPCRDARNARQRE
jgi:WhiB family redox-sensing transcriptional regulator